MKSKNPYLETITEWCLVSTSHGLPNFVRNKNKILKLIWAIATSASWGYCSYLIVIYILQYFKYEVNSSTKLFYEAPTEFPAIDICNLNPYDGSKEEVDDLIFEQMGKDISQYSKNTSLRKTENFWPMDYCPIFIINSKIRAVMD